MPLHVRSWNSYASPPLNVAWAERLLQVSWQTWAQTPMHCRCPRSHSSHRPFSASSCKSNRQIDTRVHQSLPASRDKKKGEGETSRAESTKSTEQIWTRPTRALTPSHVTDAKLVISIKPLFFPLTRFTDTHYCPPTLQLFTHCVGAYSMSKRKFRP